MFRLGSGSARFSGYQESWAKRIGPGGAWLFLKWLQQRGIVLVR